LGLAVVSRKDGVGSGEEMGQRERGLGGRMKEVVIGKFTICSDFSEKYVVKNRGFVYPAQVLWEGDQVPSNELSDALKGQKIFGATILGTEMFATSYQRSGARIGLLLDQALEETS
jgi:hypothetical protein